MAEIIGSTPTKTIERVAFLIRRSNYGQRFKKKIDDIGWPKKGPKLV